MALFLWRWPSLRMAGQLAFCGLVALSTSAVAYGASVAAGTYMVTGEIIGWGMLAFFLVLSLAMALVQALEMVETIWRDRWTREALPAAEMIAQAAGRPALAQGLAAPRDLQRAAGDGDPDHRIARGARLSELRSHRHRQQHQGSRGVAAGAGLLRPARRALQVLPLRRHEGLQGRRAELRAEPDRARRRGDRRDRQRLHGAARLAEGRGAVLRRRQDRLRAVPAGPSRLDRRPLQGNAQLGICRLLRHRHVPAQRVRRHHPARHHDAGAPHLHGGDERLGDLVHHRGHRARPAPDGDRLRRDVQPRALRPRPDARPLRRLQEAALPLGLRRHADHEGACRQDVEQRAPSSPSGRSTISSPAGCRGSPMR